MAAPTPEKESHRGAAFAVALGVLFAVYLFVPFVFAAPLSIAQRSGIISPWAANLPFAPLDWLYRKAPPYKALIESECELFERIGLPPRINR